VWSTEITQTFGIAMLVSVSTLTLISGLAVWEVMIAVSTVFAVIGLWLGVFNLPILGLLASRLSGLLENDLLQAIPLYVFFGVLLQHTGLANSMLILLKRMCWRLHLPQSVAVLLFAGFISPMNGSVASTAGLLQRTLDGERLHNDSAATVSLASCAATVGLVIPPSLVLILMGDAMMRAHTEAFNSGLLQIQGLHVMNTQDMFHAALLPGLIVFALWSLVAAWTFRHADAETDAPSLDARSLAKAWLALLLIVLLLSGVFNGVLYAVEAAATGCLVLCMYAAWLLRHKLSDWVEIWRDTFAFSGSLLSLLMAATTFSLIFRLYETDVWISNWIVHAPADVSHMAVIFAGVALCAWMMDAFELIFVIIPIVSPGLILLMGDAQQVAVLLLLVIQLSFLCPPFGYAVLIAHQSDKTISYLRLLKSLWPYMAVICAVCVLLFLYPHCVHLLGA
jgi:TRAP-type mannitol/chloroaromatic compound transport system permease large subunit